MYIVRSMFMCFSFLSCWFNNNLNVSFFCLFRCLMQFVTNECFCFETKKRVCLANCTSFTWACCAFGQVVCFWLSWHLLARFVCRILYYFRCFLRPILHRSPWCVFTSSELLLPLLLYFLSVGASHFWSIMFLRHQILGGMHNKDPSLHRPHFM